MPQSSDQMILGHAAQELVARRPINGWLQCLIVAGNESRRRALAEAASDAGWLAMECADTKAALDCWRRMFVQLAVIDLDSSGPEPARRLCELVETLAPQSGLLLILCGRESKPQEEIWARQLGIWLYLPGVVPSGDLTVLCGEARHLVERLAATRGAPTPGRVTSWAG